MLRPGTLRLNHRRVAVTTPHGDLMKTPRLSLVVLAGLLIGTGAIASEANVVVKTDVPYGNAANVRVRQDGTLTEVRFTPHPHGGPECLWFCFQVCRPGTSRAPLGKLLLILECPETMLGGSAPGKFRPVFRATGGDWHRADAPELLGLPDGRRQAAWTLDVWKPTLDFAFSFPYGRENIERLLQETKGYWRLDTIGVSQGGRPLWRLSNDYGQPKGQRPGLYLMARQHSGEVSGSWVLDGVLRRFAELGDAAPLVWAVPLANIDGVEQGDYGKDNFPYDLNRAWGRPPMRHETLVFQLDMRRWKARCRAVGCFDFHAPGAGESEGVYAYVSESPPDVAMQARHMAERLGKGLGAEFAASNFVRVARYPSRWETPRFGTFCHEELKLPAVTFEVPYALVRDTVMTRQNYQEAGRRIADAIVEGAKSE